MFSEIVENAFKEEQLLFDGYHANAWSCNKGDFACEPNDGMDTAENFMRWMDKSSKSWDGLHLMGFPPAHAI